jgi:DNA polymerase III subunit epsilon
LAKEEPQALKAKYMIPSDANDLKQWIGENPDYRLLERLTPIQTEAVQSRANDYVIILDCETTGLNADADEIIELAMLKVAITPDGKLGQILDLFSCFQEPTSPISKQITEITGITEADVADQKIDHDKVEAFIGSPTLVIAHNAGFDRLFVERRFRFFAPHPWACSINDIPWRALNFETTKLKYLLMDMGYFYTAHRALEDCNAVYHALKHCPTSTPGDQCFTSLLSNAMRTNYRIASHNSPFDKKDLLKARGYRWHDGTRQVVKHWYRDVEQVDIDDELLYLEQSIYERAVHIDPIIINATNRYSSRIYP